MNKISGNGKIFGLLRSFGIPVLAGVCALILYISLTGATALKPGEIPTNKQMEERFGIRFETVSLTAETGFVDIRYKVIDVGKAKNFGHYTETTPLVIAEETNQRVETAIMGFHNHRVEPGRTYYLLYRNTANAVKTGGKITIQIDDLKIEHVVVR